ncbi:MAG: VCBS repeat-containing protein, partial [Candidatus Sabulitectum sp.]|nr:VCBS repeat-containing protein [Candidatus Sabulitectum sp.]
IGYPARYFHSSADDPAQIIEPGEAIEVVSCSNVDVLRTVQLIQGVFADWDSYVSGADTYVLPSERQCMGWDVDGEKLDNFPTAFPAASMGSLNSPASLGDLNGDGEADVLLSTELSGDYNLLAYDSDGYPLDNSLSFPYTLPGDVSATGGFAIADIDRDGKVEIIFGASDGLLHCWELGTCATGYAPWTQYQHDAGRTGVLE